METLIVRSTVFHLDRYSLHLLRRKHAKYSIIEAQQLISRNDN